MKRFAYSILAACLFYGFPEIEFASNFVTQLNQNNQVTNNILGGAYMLEIQVFKDVAAYYNENDALPPAGYFTQTFPGASTIRSVTNNKSGGVLLTFNSGVGPLSNKSILLQPYIAGTTVNFGSSICVTDADNNNSAFQFLQSVPSFTSSILMAGSDSGYGTCAVAPTSNLLNSSYPQLQSLITQGQHAYYTSDSTTTSDEQGPESTKTSNIATK